VNDDQLFANVLEYPDPDAQGRLSALIGLDHIRDRLVTEAGLLIDPTAIEKWSARHHEVGLRAASEVASRTPLIILAGDVGTGKTELAETFADAVARALRIEMALYSLSLSARGKGIVGEMTTLIAAAFTAIATAGKACRTRDGQVRRGLVLLVDEGDALAQSRELGQMHHEDRAGVNALIRGIDELRQAGLPVLTVLCTNRPGAIDPAVRRRAAAVFHLDRPSDDQRDALLTSLLEGIRISPAQLGELVVATGPTKTRPYGYTYSDIRQRLIPEAVLAAVRRDSPLTAQDLLDAARILEPTRPFAEADQPPA
jgi:AAA+ superfamily predicted ATPase